MIPIALPLLAGQEAEAARGVSQGPHPGGARPCHPARFRRLRRCNLERGFAAVIDLVDPCAAPRVRSSPCEAEAPR